MSVPAVSVVMAVHNSASYLRPALASLRWQTLADWECVCVDDGSSDASPSILADFAAADPRFRVLRQEQAGITAALTRGDAAARSGRIARMDSDDVALPERLERQLTHMLAHPECVGVGAQVLLIDPTGAPIGPQPYATDHDEIEQRLLTARGGTIAHPTLMFRRDAAERVGGHRGEYEWAHDADLLVRLARVGRLGNLPETLLLYRQHPRNTCRTKHAEIRVQMRGLLREAYAERGLPMPPELEASFSRSSKQSPLAGKWARRAARSGNLSTAWRLWRGLATAEPRSLTTWRCGAEALTRGLLAIASGRRGDRIEAPDWREWDCPHGVAAKPQAA